LAQAVSNRIRCRCKRNRNSTATEKRTTADVAAIRRSAEARRHALDAALQQDFDAFSGSYRQRILPRNAATWH